MKSTNFLLVSIFCLLLNCSSSEDVISLPPPVDNPPIESELYFPPISGGEWETVSTTSLGWNDTNVQSLLNYIEEKGTKAFIILKNGRIAVEWYGNGETINSNLGWNSAAKTLVAFTVGIAQDEGFLDINDSSRDYLGANWSLMTDEQEQNVTIKNHLSMNTGLNFIVADQNCTDQDCLSFLANPDTFWYYHNALYTLSHDIVASAVGDTYDSYFNTKLKNQIGMQGAWIPFGYFKLYFSTARSMARFGLLNLNEGIWDETPILNDANYFEEMTNTSQSHNLSYGYLWWLNGKSSFRLPITNEESSGPLVPNAPSDMYAGLGKNDQKMYIVPSQNLVVIRLGDNAEGESLSGPSSFDNDLWEKINALTN